MVKPNTREATSTPKVGKLRWPPLPDDIELIDQEPPLSPSIAPMGSKHDLETRDFGPPDANRSVRSSGAAFKQMQDRANTQRVSSDMPRTVLASVEPDPDRGMSDIDDLMAADASVLGPDDGTAFSVVGYSADPTQKENWEDDFELDFDDRNTPSSTSPL